MKPMAVLIADDHALFRDGLTMLITGTPGLKVVGHASTADEVLRQVRQTGPDLVTLDVDMPGAPVFATIRRLLREPNAPRIVVVTVHADRVLEAEVMAAGASAYLSKGSSRSEILAALQAAPRRAREAAGLELGVSLTRRELQVLRLLAKAMSNSEIADALSIAEGTVKRHTGGIYNKLGARSRMDAVAKSKLAGLLDPRS